MVLSFSVQDLKHALELGYESGNTIPLLIAGHLREDAGGMPIVGADCVSVPHAVYVPLVLR
jgi:hypothetical protein